MQITVKDYQSSLQAEKISVGPDGRGHLGLAYMIPRIDLLEIDGWCSVTVQRCRLRALIDEDVQLPSNGTAAAAGFKVFGLADPAEHRMCHVLHRNLLDKTGVPDPRAAEVYFCSGSSG